MSTTTLTVTSSLPASLTTDEQLGRIQFIEPDTSVDPLDCDYLAIPRPLTLTHEDLPLHDVRPEIYSNPSPYGLDKTGFTAVKHNSVFHSAPYSKESFLDEKLVEDVYIPEIENLVKSVTGAKTIFPISAALRLHPALPTLKTTAEKAANPSVEPDRCGIKFDMNTFDLTKPYVGGIKPEQKVGPARAVHIDFSPKGAGKMLRCLRQDIRDETGDIIEAEDKLAENGNGEYEGRRYALYSIWRPLRTVKRDPIAVCDPSTIDEERDLIEHVYKQPGVNGDFLTEVHMLQGKNAASQKWCFLKEQTPDEVLFIQFFDSHAKKEGRPVGAPHGSPVLIGKENEEELRESVEVRVLALW